MTQKEFFNIGLPKWPALVVTGKPVTKEQAAEIIVRTNGYLSCNDHEFANRAQALIYDVDLKKVDVTHYGGTDDAIRLKVGLTKDNWNEYFGYKESKEKELGMLELNYLSNSRICSSWIGGPHGWCDWKGNIGCHNYNIGKWPSVEEVFGEWKMIAKEFPFLDLTCQLFNHEASCEDMADNPGPVIQFRVKDGKVKMSIPKEPLSVPNFGGTSYAVFTPGGEIGCTLDMLKEAIYLIKNKQLETA